MATSRLSRGFEKSACYNQEMTAALIFQLIVLIFSIMIHEIAHGAMALKLGDDTAQRLGRLTLNPLKHIDPVGSIILPAILLLFQSPFLIGWAKPVPYDPRRLRDPRTGSALIALAGPASNIVIAIFFGLLLRLSIFPEAAATLVALIVYLNLLLAIFNLIPIPPLDGSKLLFYFLPQDYRLQATLETYGPILLLIFVFGGFLQFIIPVIQFLFQLIVGQVI